MTSFEEILARAAPRETAVPLCLAGDVLTEIADLERQLADARSPTSLGERSAASVIGERIAAAQQRMRDSQHVFRLRAMHPKDWAPFYSGRPERAKDETEVAWGERWYLWTCQLVARACIDPVMTPEQVDELVGRLHPQAWSELSEAAWDTNAGKLSVPFSAAGSAWTQASAVMSRRPSEPASPTVDGSAPNQVQPPPTSMTTPAD